jgi:hypothetical protein
VFLEGYQLLPSMNILLRKEQEPYMPLLLKSGKGLTYYEGEDMLQLWPTPIWLPS